MCINGKFTDHKHAVVMQFGSLKDTHDGEFDIFVVIFI